jgi:membrane protein
MLKQEIMERKFHIKDVPSLFKETIKSWNDDDPFYMSAVVAYYTVFALPGLLFLVIYIAGLVWKEGDVRDEVITQIESALGQDSAAQMEMIIDRAIGVPTSPFMMIVSIGALIFGATGVFFMLQKSLNMVWNVVEDPKRGILIMLKARAIGLGLIVVIGFLLLVSLLLTTAINVMSEWILEFLPHYLYYVFLIINFLISLGIITLLFAIIYKVLPDVVIGWRTLWIGSIVTASLFVIGKYALGLYFSLADPADAYGVTGSLVILLLWVSYSCLLIFFGAEFTQVYARKYGRKVVPKKHALRVKTQFIRDEDANVADEEASKAEIKS